MYIFDTSPLSTLFKNYYRNRFPSLWNHFDNLVATGKITSTREVFHEVNDGPVEGLITWATSKQTLFATPVPAEALFVSRIYQVPHFQQNIEQRKLLTGGRNADPFVIAKAAIEQKVVVTMEKQKPNSVKIPTICSYFNIKCIDLEEFMIAENWTF